MVKSIFLQDGEEIFVDDEDFERVSQYVWHKGYAGNTRIIRNNDLKMLTSFILPNSYQKLKNNYFTRNNLTTKGNSQRWMKATYNNFSKYKGVTWHKRNKKWQTSIRLEGKLKYLGQYANEDDAARAYNQAVFDYWDGEGYLNVIGEDNRTSIRDYRTLMGQKKQRVGKTGYKGVAKSKNSYCVEICKNKSRYYLGTFQSKHEAALVYNKCAIYLYGDAAILNDVPMTDELKEFISNWEIPEKIKRLKDEANEHINQDRE